MFLYVSLPQGMAALLLELDYIAISFLFYLALVKPLQFAQYTVWNCFKLKTACFLSVVILVSPL